MLTIFNHVSSNNFYYLKKLGCTSGSASPPLSLIMLPTQALNSKDHSLYNQTFDLKIIKFFRKFFHFNKQNCFILNDYHNFSRIFVNINLRRGHLNVEITWMFFKWSKNKLYKWNQQIKLILNPKVFKASYR